jgi:hypothetical protein
MLYMVSYDLMKNDKDYDRITDRLKDLNAVRVLFSEWFLISNATATDVYNLLKDYVDGNDKLFVTELTKNSSWRNLMITDADAQKWFAHARS